MDKLLKINKKYIDKKIEAYISAINRFFLAITFFPDFLLKRAKIIELKIEVDLLNNEKSNLLKKLIA